MITFLISIALLILGYIFYGRFIDRYFGADPNRLTPAVAKNDGVDYITLKPFKIYIIQFLNIAGLGPIFGAVLGAAYGPIAYLWIVIGCIFFGAAHDYVSGMLSLRLDGTSLPEIVKRYLGSGVSRVITIFTVLLLLAVGASFVNGPAGVLSKLTGIDLNIWLFIIFGYYIIATLLPIDKIIGKVYPFMGAALLFMALGIGIMLIINTLNGSVDMIELTPDTFKNFKSNGEEYLLFPMLFIVISCGAISGFHATQSPMMARCMSNEKYGKKIFYGAMISEGIVACIWASAAMAFFNGPDGLNIAVDGGQSPAIIVNNITQSWLGKIGAVIAIIGVVACPITTGDTAFRGMRLIIADSINYSQKKIKNRLVITIPLFAIAYIVCNVDFSTIWTYVGISNQVLATITLWTCAAYFVSVKKSHFIMSIPAAFLTYICVSYFAIAPHIQGGLNLPPHIGNIIAGIVTICVVGLFFRFVKKSSASLIE